MAVECTEGISVDMDDGCAEMEPEMGDSVGTACTLQMRKRSSESVK